MAKLEQLTNEQEILIHEVANEWKDFIFSCKNTEIDKQKALKGRIKIKIIVDEIPK